VAVLAAELVALVALAATNVEATKVAPTIAPTRRSTRQWDFTNPLAFSFMAAPFEGKPSPASP
jgi:hypothetical protein